MLVVQGHGRDRGQRDSLVSGSEEDVKVGDLAGYDGRRKGRRRSGDEGARVEEPGVEKVGRLSIVTTSEPASGSER